MKETGCDFFYLLSDPVVGKTGIIESQDAADCTVDKVKSKDFDISKVFLQSISSCEGVCGVISHRKVTAWH